MKRPPIRPEWKEELENLLKKYDLQGIVVITSNRNGNIDTHTYGENKFKCDALSTWIENWEGQAISLVPWQTVFGWGNNGDPKHLTEDQKNQLPKSWKKFA